MRAQTGNELITAEQVDLASLHSIRKFATKWVDNAPPRRLDMIVLCANTRTPSGGAAFYTEDGLEATWGLNYMANFHLLSILSPALRAQPPDRDVRIIFGTCSSYLGGVLPVSTAVAAEKGKKEKLEAPPTQPPNSHSCPLPLPSKNTLPLTLAPTRTPSMRASLLLTRAGLARLVCAASSLLAACGASLST
jgi:NAD(P)-dependent dehydrogenase (short-subunit alcohol dehydrogenase family)